MNKIIRRAARLTAGFGQARRGFGSDCRGMAAIEMALVFPFMLTVLVTLAP